MLRKLLELKRLVFMTLAVFILTWPTVQAGTMTAKIGDDEWITGTELWYSPSFFASADEAVRTIKSLENRYVGWKGYPIRDVQIDWDRLRVYGVEEGTHTYQKWVYTGVGVLGGHNVPVVEPYRYEETSLVPFGQVKDILLWHYPKTSRENKWGVDIRLSGEQQVILRAKSLDDAKNIANAIATLAVAQGKRLPVKAGLGVYADPAAEGKERANLKWTQNTGAVVADVIDNSPAAVAGIQVGDIILTLGGTEVTNGLKLRELLSVLSMGSDKPDYPMDFSFVRKGVAGSGQIKLANSNYNIDRIAKNAVPPSSAADKPGFGVSVRSVNADDAKMLNLSTVQGLLVTDVRKNSLAEKMNIQLNDVIIEVNGTTVNTTDQLKQVLTAGTVASAKVIRAGNPLILEAPISF
ncbi:PDZ domain-containing protein [Anaeroselena agilis]|uniref:PDZ domain-containing protein n=1 Tax=Anaeroselena agilis TaxID=3063788 RepID=A0ABU3NVI2_9FIRM|nr:PDZ domain-containing protein [Selenomonadales bacterium 4137-cl]